MDSVVALHRKTLYYSVNSRLGSSHLSYLYSEMQKDITCLSMAAVSHEEVLGVVSAVLDPGKFTPASWRAAGQALGCIAYPPGQSTARLAGRVGKL